MNRWLVLVVLALLAGPVLAEEEEKKPPLRPGVLIDSGVIGGEFVGKDRDVHVFRGIPYAAPPVGDLRWRPPAPVGPWEAFRNCVRFGPAAPQPGGFGRAGGHTGNQSEDCLYLNVWAPADPGEGKLPVMVWIHGGGMVIGAGSLPFYDGESFARRGVVLVTINYRLGPFGFFGHPALSAESEENVSGNYGLLDQIAALQWVKRNAAAFGGDPGCVTIFGESAGAVSVCCLMTSPLAKGLFHRAIAQSGTTTAVRTRLRGGKADADTLEARGTALAAALGVAGADDVAAALRALPTEKILADARPEPVSFKKERKYFPVVDGHVLPAAPSAVWARGGQHDVPVMIGANAHDGGIFADMLPVRQVVGYRWLVRRILKEEANDVLDAFPVATAADVRNAVRDIMTVSAFVAPARRFARAMEKVTSPCWLYHFSRVSPLAAQSGAGAAHGFEIPYVFGNLYPWLGTTEEDARLSRAMQDCWIRFAKAGDPNAEGPVKWPAYTTENDTHADFGDGIRIGTGLLREKCDLFDRIAAKSPTGPRINLPPSRTVGKANLIEGPVFRITVTADGRAHVEGKALSNRDSQQRLIEASEWRRDLEHPMQPSECVVVLRLDRAVTWDRARTLIAACEDPEVRIYRIYLAVIPPEGGTEGVFGIFVPKTPGMATFRLGRSYPPGTVGARVELRERGVKQVPTESLAWRIAGLPAAGKKRPVWLSPDAGIRVDEVVEVLDVLHRTGVVGVVFPPVPPGGIGRPPGAITRYGMLLNAEPVRRAKAAGSAKAVLRPYGGYSAGFDRAPDWGSFDVGSPSLPRLAYPPTLPRLRFRAVRDYAAPSATFHLDSRIAAASDFRFTCRLLLKKLADSGRIVVRADSETPWRAVSDLVLRGIHPEIGIHEFAFAFEPVTGIREGAVRFLIAPDRDTRKTPWKPEPGNRARVILRGDRDASGLAAALSELPENWNTQAAWLLVEEDVPLGQVLSAVQTLVAAGVSKFVFALPPTSTGAKGLWLNGRQVPRSPEPADETMLAVDRIYADIRWELTLEYFGR